MIAKRCPDGAGDRPGEVIAGHQPDPSGSRWRWRYLPGPHAGHPSKGRQAPRIAERLVRRQSAGASARADDSLEGVRTAVSLAKRSRTRPSSERQRERRRLAGPPATCVLRAEGRGDQVRARPRGGGEGQRRLPALTPSPPHRPRRAPGAPRMAGHQPFLPGGSAVGSSPRFSAGALRCEGNRCLGRQRPAPCGSGQQAASQRRKRHGQKSSTRRRHRLGNSWPDSQRAQRRQRCPPLAAA